jgi:2-C-methyl-D-erythritol 4-phosphate cytidylyltransferase
VLRCGGESRARSVANGLDALAAAGAAADDWVLVHDAARCLVRPDWIDRLIDACSADPVGGLLAVPVADTLKREHDGRVASTVGRAGLRQAQTPQMFRLRPLRERLAAHGDGATDEASAMEAAGYRPLLVAGDAENFSSPTRPISPWRSGCFRPARDPTDEHDQGATLDLADRRGLGHP